MANPNYYQILGLERLATPDEIKNAYRDLSKRWIGHSLEANAEVEINRLNEAHRVLINPATRKDYDATLGEAPWEPYTPASPKAPSARPTQAQPEVKSKMGLILGGSAAAVVLLAGLVAFSMGGKSAHVTAAGIQNDAVETAPDTPSANTAKETTGPTKDDSADIAQLIKARADKEKADKEKIEKDKLDKENALKDKIEKDKADKILADKILADKLLADRTKPEVKKAPEVRVPTPTPVAVAPVAPVAPVPHPTAAAEPNASEPRSVAALAACPKQEAPAVPKHIMGVPGESKVTAKVSVVGGVIKDVAFLSGPKVFYPNVRAAIMNYQCKDMGNVYFVEEYRFSVDN